MPDASGSSLQWLKLADGGHGYDMKKKTDICMRVVLTAVAGGRRFVTCQAR